ncbi:PilZ domain-containing protein, partial [Pseudomonas syringae pv. tagetis]
QGFGVGVDVSLNMVLMPLAGGLLLGGWVSECDGRADGGFVVSTDFVKLPDPQRLLLARHVLLRKAQPRRQAL